MSDDTPIPFPARGDVQEDLRALFRGAIRFTLESFLEQELVEMIGAGRYQRVTQCRDARNGSYLRRLLTGLGHVELSVPRSRESGSPGRESLGRCRRRTEEPISYFLLDATFLGARWARRAENVSALVASCIGPDGKRQLLAVTIGAREAEESWTDLLQQLVERGLSGVRLVVADGQAGPWKVVRRLVPEAQHQRCTVHLRRNVQAKAPQRLRPRAAREVVGILHAPSLAEANERKKTLEQGLGREVPEAAACLDDGFSAATANYACPETHWRRVRSTNGLERPHGEIKRRIRRVDPFPDRASALRLSTAVALQVTAMWSDRRYLDMSELAGDEENDRAA